MENEKTELDKYMLLYRNWITNKDLLCSPGLCNDLYGERIYNGMEICIGVIGSLCYIGDTNTTLYINYTPIKYF